MKLQLKRAGMHELLTSDAMRRELADQAERIAARAGPGHVVKSGIGRNRARAVVTTDTIEAMLNEATKRTLTRAAR